MPESITICKPPTRISICLIGKSHAVGHVVGDIFHKTIQGSKHLLRKPPAIAFDTSTLEDAKHAGAVFVIVTDSETGKRYRASIKAVFRHGTPFNRGHGEQIYLPLGWWKAPDAPQQASLFAEVGV